MSSEDSIEALRDSVMKDINRQISPGHSSIPQLAFDTQRRETQIEDLQREIAMLKEECEACKSNCTQEVKEVMEAKEILIQKLNSRLGDMENELTQTYLKMKEFEEIKGKLFDYEQKIADLTQTLVLFHEGEGQWHLQKANFEQQIKSLRLQQEVVRKAKRLYDSELSEKLLTQHLEAKQLTAQALHLSQEMQILAGKRKKTLKLYAFTLLSHRLRLTFLETIHMWKRSERLQDRFLRKKTYAIARISGLIRNGLIYAFLTWKTTPKASIFTPESSSDSRTLSSTATDLDFSYIEKEETSDGNLFLKVVNSAPAQWGPAMHRTKVLRLIDEILDRKYEIDMTDIGTNAEFRSFAECISDFFVRKLGFSKRTVQEISGFVSGLCKLNREGNEYVRLFTRMVNVFSDAPIPVEVGRFLVHLRAKLMRVQGSRRLSQKKEGGYKAKKTGELLLIDLFPIIFDLFASDREAGTTIILNLKPEKTQIADYIFFLLCYDITKQGMKAETAFLKADPERKGALTAPELASGIYPLTKMWVRQTDLEAAFTSLSKGTITLKDFPKLVKIDQFVQLKNSLMFTASKIDVLNVVSEAYSEMLERNCLRLKKIYYKHCALLEHMSVTECSAALQEIETYPHIEKLIDSLSDTINPQSGLTFDSFLRLSLDHNLGNLKFGPFRKRLTQESKAKSDFLLMKKRQIKDFIMKARLPDHENGQILFVFPNKL